MLKFPIYLDHNATTPCDKQVVEAMVPYFGEHFGNAASRNHSYGWQADEAVNIAREQVAELIDAEPGEIIFTSGATEADNLALKGVFEAYRSKGNHIITVVTEHKAVLDACTHLERQGARITRLPVDSFGMVDLHEMETAITADTILVSVMYANNETGTVQKVKEIGKLAKKHKVLFFCDATQAVGKLAVNVLEDEIDLMAFSAHKMYGPKGVGALYVRRKNPRVKLIAQVDGGGHEKGIRSGTLNVPGIVGFGKACELAGKVLVEDSARLSALRKRLENGLLKIDDVVVNGNRENRLPHVSNLSFRYVDGEALIAALNKYIAVSSGAACSSASLEPSYVLKALGLEDELAFGSIRFSLGRHTTEEEIDFTIEEVQKAVIKLRELYVQVKS